MISIIIPVYNQYSSLVKVLRAFTVQTINSDKCEFIIIDDGSADELCNCSFIECAESLNYKIVHTKNRGRAAARNVGIQESRGELLIFCDADRFPNPDFINQHLKSHQKEADIVIGASYDYFGKENYVNNNINWYVIEKFSRLPLYFKKTASLYDEKGQTMSKLSWLSFLVGNSSIKRSVIENAGGFDESFVEWGFEHFDLAYRLYCSGYRFSLNKDAINYHIPHPRQEGFYRQAIVSNAKKFCDKYPEVCEEMLAGYIAGSIDNDTAENSIYILNSREVRDEYK